MSSLSLPLSPSLLQSDVAEVVRQLGVCGQRKIYLKEFCAVVMGDLVERCGEEVVRECIVPGLERMGRLHPGDTLLAVALGTTLWKGDLGCYVV